jgi:hypothetical protein
MGIGLSGLGVLIAIVFCRVPKSVSPSDEEQRLLNDDTSFRTSLNTDINTNTINDGDLRDDFPKV